MGSSGPGDASNILLDVNLSALVGVDADVFEGLTMFRLQFPAAQIFEFDQNSFLL